MELPHTTIMLTNKISSDFFVWSIVKKILLDRNIIKYLKYVCF